MFKYATTPVPVPKRRRLFYSVLLDSTPFGLLRVSCCHPRTVANIFSAPLRLLQRTAVCYSTYGLLSFPTVGGTVLLLFSRRLRALPSYHSLWTGVGCVPLVWVEEWRADVVFWRNDVHLFLDNKMNMLAWFVCELLHCWQGWQHAGALGACALRGRLRVYATLQDCWLGVVALRH